MAIIFIFSLVAIPFLFSQVPDSLITEVVIDSTQIIVPQIAIDTSDLAEQGLLTKKSGKAKKPREERLFYRVFKKDYPQPKMALFTSLAFPGLGQIYNKRWWKAPFVWGGMTFFIIRSIQDTNSYILFRDALVAELSDPSETHRFTGILDSGDLRRLRDAYDNNRQLFYFGTLGVYIIAGAEAFVDAHLRTFDVSDDLTLRLKLKPSLEMDAFAQPIAGVGLSFYLDKKAQVPSFHVMSDH